MAGIDLKPLSGFRTPVEVFIVPAFSEGTMKRAPYVCVCVRASVRACVNEKCYFSSISWPILILFVLSDTAGWGLQNFYTEF